MPSDTACSTQHVVPLPPVLNLLYCPRQFGADERTELYEPRTAKLRRAGYGRVRIGILLHLYDEY